MGVPENLKPTPMIVDIYSLIREDDDRSPGLSKAILPLVKNLRDEVLTIGYSAWWIYMSCHVCDDDLELIITTSGEILILFYDLIHSSCARSLQKIQQARPP